jgi:hypothetical protein
MSQKPTILASIIAFIYYLLRFFKSKYPTHTANNELTTTHSENTLPDGYRPSETKEEALHSHGQHKQTQQDIASNRKLAAAAKKAIASIEETIELPGVEAPEEEKEKDTKTQKNESGVQEQESASEENKTAEQKKSTQQKKKADKLNIVLQTDELNAKVLAARRRGAARRSGQGKGGPADEMIRLREEEQQRNVVRLMEERQRNDMQGFGR